MGDYLSRNDIKLILATGLTQTPYDTVKFYYKIKNARLTVDKKIIYKKFIDKNISNLYTNDNFNVAEIKQPSSIFSNIFNKNFPFDRSRFSKYCRGVEFTKYNYCNELF